MGLGDGLPASIVGAEVVGLGVGLCVGEEVDGIGVGGGTGAIVG